MSKKRALVAANSDVSGDPRPKRMVSWLSEKYAVVDVLAKTEYVNTEGVKTEILNNEKNNIIKKIFAALLLKTCNYKWFSEQYLPSSNSSQLEGYDLIVVHDLYLLPLILRIKGSAKIVFDAREYYPKHYEDQFVWKFFFAGLNNYLCSEYLPKVDKLITVSDGLAREYEAVYSVKASVLPGYPKFQKMEPKKVDKDKIRIIYHGNCNPSRNIHEMIEMMGYVEERYELDLMLMPLPGNKYYEFLIKKAKEAENVNIIPPVTFDEIVTFTNDYDIGLYFIKPSTFNLRYSLPNKFFEYIQARLCVVSGPSVEVHKYIKKYNIGQTSKTFEPHDIASVLNELTASDLEKFKLNSHTAAKELNQRKSKAIFFKYLDDLDITKSRFEFV